MDAEKVKTIARPACVENGHLVFLDILQESGKTNMFGARPYLLKEYPELTKEQAGQVLKYWMNTF